MPTVDETVAGDVKVSLVVPAYNEQRRLPGTLEAISTHMDASGVSYEIVVVDDGSSDATAALVENYALSHPRVKLLRHEANRGKGAAVRTGMLRATGDFIIFTDADLSTPIETTQHFLHALSNGTDVIVGNRRMPESRLEVRQPWLREFLGRIFTRMTRLVLRSNVTDQTCGFKGFKREAAREIFTRQRLADWSFDAEILHIAARRGMRLKQVPVTWHDEAGSKVRVVSAGMRSLMGLARVWHNGLRGRYD